MLNKTIALIVLSVALFSDSGRCGDAPGVRLTALGADSYSFGFQIESSGVFDYLVERATSLSEWEPAVHVFSRFDKFRAFEAFNGFKGLVAPQPSDARFYRVNGRAQTPAAMKSAWLDLGHTHYQFTFTRRCFNCRPMRITLAATLAVENGTIVQVENVRDPTAPLTPVSNPDVTQFKSIEEILDLISTAATAADLLEVHIDPARKFPAWVSIDYFRDIADDEISYSVSDVVFLD